MRLPSSLRAGVYGTGALVAITGTLWLIVHDTWRRFAATCMELHGGSAMILLVLIGAAAALHAPAGWRERKNRVSGAVLSTVLAILLLTGVLLYYAGDERARGLASVVHWTLGLGAIAALYVHVWLGRRASVAA